MAETWQRLVRRVREGKRAIMANMANMAEEGTYSPERVDLAIAALRTRIRQTCADWASETQTVARQNAPWTDRGGKDSLTGKTARESLEAEMGIIGDERILIVLRSTRASTRSWRGGPHAPVGAFLELGTRRMRKYNVIWPTLEHQTPALQARLRAVMQV